MSNLAYALPQRSPRHEEERTRHVEIVPTRAQRRSRPKIFYALVTVSALFALFMAQLLLSIVLADGAYQISSLRVEQRDLSRQEASLGEKLDLLRSPQNLATRAENLGMVTNGATPMFLRLSDGKVLGSAAAAGAGVQLIGADGTRVPNALLTGLEAFDPEAGNTTDSGEPSKTETASSVTSSPGTLPSPVTR